MKLATAIRKMNWDSETDPFLGSPYAAIASIRSTIRKNRRISKTLAITLRSKGYDVEERKGMSDLIVDGDRCMVRLSTSTKTTGQWSELYDYAAYKYVYLVHLQPEAENTFCLPMNDLSISVGTVGCTKNNVLICDIQELEPWRVT